MVLIKWEWPLGPRLEYPGPRVLRLEEKGLLSLQENCRVASSTGTFLILLN